MKKVLKVGSILVSLAILTFLGGFQGVEWAENVVKFWVWSCLLIGLVLLVLSLLTFTEPDPSKKRKITWRFTLDTLLALGMAAVGWIFTAGAYLLFAIIVQLYNWIED